MFREPCLRSSPGVWTRVGVPTPGRPYLLAVPVDGGLYPGKLLLQFLLPPSRVPPCALNSSPAGSFAPLGPLVGSLPQLDWLRGGLPSRMEGVLVTFLPSFDPSPPSLFRMATFWCPFWDDLFVNTFAGLFSCLFSILGTVSFNPRLARKDATSSTGDLYFLGY